MFFDFDRTPREWATMFLAFALSTLVFIGAMIAALAILPADPELATPGQITGLILGSFATQSALLWFALDPIVNATFTIHSKYFN